MKAWNGMLEHSEIQHFSLDIFSLLEPAAAFLIIVCRYPQVKGSCAHTSYTLALM